MPTATAASKIAAPKPVPVPNGDFYQLVDLLTPEEESGRQKGADIYGDQGPAGHQQVLVR